MIPPRVILAPVDFSEPSRTALATAGRLARHTGAALTVVFAESPLLAEGARRAQIDLQAETRRELDQFISATPQAAAVSPRTLIATGDAAAVIRGAAEELKADLLVVGSHGMSAAAHFVFGSTTEGVLRKSPVSVLVTPASWVPASPTASDMAGTGPVITAVDFGRESMAAARSACQLAAALKTGVTLVHVVADDVGRERWRSHAASLLENRVNEVRTQLDSFAQTLASPVNVSTRVETGDVATQLAAVAAPGPTTHPLLVLGRKPPRERDGAPGAIAYRVLTLAQVPVLVHVEP